MQAKINVPNANHSSETANFDPGDAIDPGKTGLKIMRNSFAPRVLNVESASSGEQIDATFFGIALVFRTWLAGRALDKFVVTWPERKLIHHVLGLDDVTRWVPWPFDAFVVQIECDLGGAIAFVGDEEKSFFCLLFELNAKIFQRESRTFPAAHAIRWIAPLDFNPDAAQHVAIQSQHAHD